MSRVTKRSKRPLILIGVCLIVAGVAVYFLLRPDRNAVKVNPTEDFSTAMNEVGTYEATSEGSTFPVPNTVPKDSIKNYTLLTENEQYKIRQDPESKAYVITLYAIINRPEQYDAYKEQLREFKQNALKYLSDQGINTNSSQIIYEPEEATQL